MPHLKSEFAPRRTSRRPSLRRNRRLLGLFAFGLFCLPVAAFADDKPKPPNVAGGEAQGPSKADVQRADATFKRAVALKKQGKMAEACPLFEESQVLDPNGATLVNLAECHEAEGKTGTAWRELFEAYKLAKLSEDKEIVAWTKAQLQAIVPKLHQFTVLIPAEMAMIPGVTVRLDDQLLKVAVPSHFVVVDPGKHTLMASAPGYIDFRREVEFTDPERKITITVLLKKPPPLPPPPLDYRPSIVVLAGGGAALVASGVLFGTTLANDNDGGLVIATVVTGAVGIGSTLLGAGLWPSSPKPPAPVTLHSPSVQVTAAPLIGPTIAGAVVSGLF